MNARLVVSSTGIPEAWLCSGVKRASGKDPSPSRESQGRVLQAPGTHWRCVREAE